MPGYKKLDVDSLRNNLKISKERYDADYAALSTLKYYTPEEINSIILRRQSPPIVKNVIAFTKSLDKKGFTREEILKLARHSGGSLELEAADKYYDELKNLGFDAKLITKLIGHSGGSHTPPIVITHYDELEKWGFNAKKIVDLAGYLLGSHTLQAVIDNQAMLIEFGFNADTLVELAGHSNGFYKLESVIFIQAMLSAREFNADSIVELTRGNWWQDVVRNFMKYYDKLEKLKVDAATIVELTRGVDGGSQRLQAFFTQQSQALLEKAVNEEVGATRPNELTETRVESSPADLSHPSVDQSDMSFPPAQASKRTSPATTPSPTAEYSFFNSFPTTPLVDSSLKRQYPKDKQTASDSSTAGSSARAAHFTFSHEPRAGTGKRRHISDACTTDPAPLTTSSPTASANSSARASKRRKPDTAPAPKQSPTAWPQTLHASLETAVNKKADAHLVLMPTVPAIPEKPANPPPEDPPNELFDIFFPDVDLSNSSAIVGSSAQAPEQRKPEPGIGSNGISARELAALFELSPPPPPIPQDYQRFSQARIPSPFVVPPRLK